MGQKKKKGGSWLSKEWLVKYEKLEEICKTREKSEEGQPIQGLELSLTQYSMELIMQAKIQRKLRKKIMRQKEERNELERINREYMK